TDTALFPVVEGDCVRFTAVRKLPSGTAAPPLSTWLFESTSRYPWTLLPVMLVVACVPLPSHPAGDSVPPGAGPDTGVCGPFSGSSTKTLYESLAVRFCTASTRPSPLTSVSCRRLLFCVHVSTWKPTAS